MRLLAASPWEFGWVAVAAIATSLLAALTYFLARSTRALAEETNEDVRAGWRPIVAVPSNASFAPMSVKMVGDGCYEINARFTLLNVGRGPALNTVAVGEFGHSDDVPLRASCRINTLAVDIAHFAVFSVTTKGFVPHVPDAWFRDQRFPFTVAYEDVAANSYETLLVFTGKASEEPRAEMPAEFSAELIDTQLRTPRSLPGLDHFGEQPPQFGF
jgi:hypothetical protein